METPSLFFLESSMIHYYQCYCRWCHVNKKKLPNIKCFTYVFPCDFAKKNNEAVIEYSA